MTYIRTKKISNKSYAYLVENISTKNGPRQKVKKYLGRVHHLKKQENKDITIMTNNKNEFLKQLISKHLFEFGFEKNKKNLVNDKIIFSLNKMSFKKGVLAINEGYLCNFTIKRILEFNKTNDLQKDGTLLAKHFLTAGLPVSQNEFIQFYQML
jgi:endo-alpha-1,4-polygalactosaminidase (GH114 family)